MTERRSQSRGIRLAQRKQAQTKKGRTLAKPAANISPARRAAFDILQRIAAGNAHSDDLLHGPAMAELSQTDRDLTTALVLGTLRWQIALDARVRALFQRPDVAPALPVMLALRLGAFQHMHLERIPAHAAINESVELVRASGHSHAAGMVNAVLRKLVGAPTQSKRLLESTAAFAERLGHPLWLVERWVVNYGRAAAIDICEFDQHEPRCGTLFTDKVHAAELPERHSGSEHEQSAPSWPPLMDDGSRLVAEIAAASIPTPARMWDCCAAPGGKTLVMAHRHRNAELLATDINRHRLHRLAERLKREAPGAKARTLVADATALSESEGCFDLILCDVPCSGTGTLARNPEIRHALRPEDLPRQAERQRAILSSALQRLATGGRLIYSTCSLEPEENEQVVEAVLHQPQHRGVVRLSAGPILQQLKERGVLAPNADLSKSVQDGLLRTLPGHGFEGDGFFAAVLACD